MYKYKISPSLKYFVCFLFCLFALVSCSESSSKKLIDEPQKNIYVLEVEHEAGQIIDPAKELLSPPFNLVKVRACTVTDSTNIFGNGVLLSSALKKSSHTSGRLVCGLRLKQRNTMNYKIIPVFIPLEESSFKYLPSEQFRLKYDEMLRIAQNWIWNYYGYRTWSFDSWVSISFMHQGLEPCLTANKY